MDALRLSGPIEDSAELMRLFDAENAIAWKVARRDGSAVFGVGADVSWRLRARCRCRRLRTIFAGSMRRRMTERLKRLKNAVSQVPNYPAALLELGKEQYAQSDFEGAAATLAKVPKTDRLALEANFYLGLADFNSANYAGAQAAFSFVATRLPLPEVVNNEAVAVSRQGKDSVELFRKASRCGPVG